MSLVQNVVFVPVCARLFAGHLSALQAIAECQLNIGLTAFSQPCNFVRASATDPLSSSDASACNSPNMPCLVCLQVLNYGQSVFEGMKAQRSAQNRIVLFRPQQNAARMAEGADRLSMPAPPTDLFVGAVQQLVRENQDYVPPQGKGSLYIRPLLMGSGGILGLGPAPSYTFAVFCAAVGAYFKVSCD